MDHGENISWLAFRNGKIKEINDCLDNLDSSDSAVIIKQTAIDIFNGLTFHGIEIHEPNYRFTDSSGNVFKLSWFGGAPLVWCMQTSAIVHRSLSPDVPNAGDLDSGLIALGFECYGVPPEYLDSTD